MRNKSDLYKDEQYLFVDKLIDILNLDEDNSITLYDLDNNEDIKEKILYLIPEIKKYFRFDCIHGVRNTEIVKRPYLSIIRNIIKLKYNMVISNYHTKRDNKHVRTKKYIFLLKNE